MEVVFSAAGKFYSWIEAYFLHILGVLCVASLIHCLLKICEYAGEVIFGL